MDFKQCDYILKIYEKGNITKAAGELFISQPALSHYVSKVEEELGTRIFNRDTNPLTLTEAGEVYVESAKQILDIRKHMNERIREIRMQERGKIRIGMAHSRASFLLPYVMTEFHEKFPDYDVIPVQTSYSDGERNVINGTVDFAIMSLSMLENPLESELLLKEELLIVSGKELPHKEITNAAGIRKQYVTVEDFCHENLLISEKKHGLRTMFDFLLLEHGVEHAAIQEVKGNETIYRLAASGMGVGMVPQSTVLLTRTIQKPYLYSIGEKGLYWNIGAVYRNRKMLTRAQREFLELLKNKMDGLFEQ